MRGRLSEDLRSLTDVAVIFRQQPATTGGQHFGSRIVFDRIQPQLSRLSLSAGWRRLFGMQGWVEFAKGAFKLADIRTDL